MTIETNDKRRVILSRFHLNDLDNLIEYFDNLSYETKNRFGPHLFDRQSVIDFYNYTNIHLAYIAKTIDTNKIVAYFLIKLGYLEADYNRFLSYGIKLNSHLDCEFAPSVADLWQSSGIGNKFFQYILEDLKKTEVRRVVLWGGVQAGNDKAVNFYKKNNFKLLGQFSHNGENFDMLLEI